jgi:hypothetical protein
VGAARYECKGPNELSQFAAVACVVVGFVSALFLAFVCAIGSEQWEAIRDDMPKIDRLQKKAKEEDKEETFYEVPNPRSGQYVG